MADLRITPGLPAPRPSARTATPRAEAVRAAQRAFFQTALAGETAAAAPARAAAAPAEAAAPSPVREVRAAIDPAAPAPARSLRPGSLLDIKV